MKQYRFSHGCATPPPATELFGPGVVGLSPEELAKKKHLDSLSNLYSPDPWFHDDAEQFIYRSLEKGRFTQQDFKNAFYWMMRQKVKERREA